MPTTRASGPLQMRQNWDVFLLAESCIAWQHYTLEYMAGTSYEKETLRRVAEAWRMSRGVDRSHVTEVDLPNSVTKTPPTRQRVASVSGLIQRLLVLTWRPRWLMSLAFRKTSSWMKEFFCESSVWRHAS